MMYHKSAASKTNTMSIKIHFIFRMDSLNTGDLFSCVLNYYQDAFHKYTILLHDCNEIQWDTMRDNDIFIIGGGGLINLNEGLNQQINRIIAAFPQTVLYAAGFNTHYGRPVPQEPIRFQNFRLAAIRDYNHPAKLRYVPCPSCMIPELTDSYRLQRHIGVIMHKDYILKDFLQYDFITNSYPIKIITRFIGSSEIIITSSYHIAYWATLMQKRVILHNVFSEKFSFLKYPPVTFSGDLKSDIKKSIIYSDALTDSVLLNKNFFRDISIDFGL